jgi:hypothetical protein
MHVPIQQVLGFVEIAVCLMVFCFLAAKGKWRDYWALETFLVVRAVSDGAMFVVKHFAPELGNAAAYRIYFYVYWLSFAFESTLVILILYGLVRLMMAPLKGLQIVARLVFCVTALVSLTASLWLCVGPNMTMATTMISAISQLHRVQSMLVLCLLLFITFALRTLGLSFRSRVFGVSLGLGIMATNDLVQSARLMFHPATSGATSVFNGVMFCAILLVWTIYFALPEPGREELAADSPILRWNEACVPYCGNFN